MKKIYMSLAFALGLLSVSPVFAMAQTQNTYEQAVPYGNMMYGTAGTQIKSLPAFQAQNGQGEITFQSPMMSGYGYKTFAFRPYSHFSSFGFIACAITLLMLWILMALAIVWLATHLKKNLHK